LKVVHKNHLGLNFLTGTIHVDNWDGSSSNMSYKLLCGDKERNNYQIFEIESFKRHQIFEIESFKRHPDLNFKLCKICTKLALKKKRCLVSAVALLKLKGI